ncbi:unnamed protein product [Protopolystoma xenopodis]|uniref:tRNA (adenine(58)-N(1))-methyltransferase n=1 Tax=Protopolystoma xenopodis TaxID=117903 RepID=A0A3S5AUQ6_9PLAT|nr:unnamed protein product [Protopolystoma xenopodis]
MHASPFAKSFASEGDCVIIIYGRDDTIPIILKANDLIQTKYGALRHNDIIGKRYGSQIPTSRGHVHILALNPVIWSHSLPHRTQILYPPDISLIVGSLDLRPGRCVLEAGTGSGSLTHALAQAIWPNGRVITFDFHELRSQKASEEFKV